MSDFGGQRGEQPGLNANGKRIHEAVERPGAGKRSESVCGLKSVPY